MDGRLEALTSIRFFAAFFVLLSHLSFLKDTPYDYLYVEDGFVGVTLFFILSGFILSYSYKQRILDKTISYKKFWLSRIYRIYPLHVLTLILAIPLSLSISNLIAFIPNLFLFQSLIPVKDIYFSLNAPSWSISTELFFYAFFPALILLKSRSLLQAFIILLLVQLFIINFSNNLDVKHALIYINPFFRISDFILGIILFNLYIVYKDKVHNNVIFLQYLSVLLLILFVIFSKFIDLNQTYKFSIYYLMPMSLIIFSFAFKTNFSNILNNKFLLILGESSFALYLIHQLVIRYTVSINKRFFFLDEFFLIIFILVLCISISIFLYYKFEKPSQKYLLRIVKK